MSQAVLRTPLLAAALLAFGFSTAVAQSDIRTEKVHFKPGTSSATLEGKIKGRETVDYVLEASKGQHMNVSMATNNGANYFNILAPGENEVAMFNGSVGENQFEGTLPKSGNYKIRVYMMRSAARRDEVAKYRLEMIVTGAAEKASTAGEAGPDKMMARCRARARPKSWASPQAQSRSSMKVNAPTRHTPSMDRHPCAAKARPSSVRSTARVVRS